MADDQSQTNSPGNPGTGAGSSFDNSGGSSAGNITPEQWAQAKIQFTLNYKRQPSNDNELRRFMADQSRRRAGQAERQAVETKPVAPLRTEPLNPPATGAPTPPQSQEHEHPDRPARSASPTQSQTPQSAAPDPSADRSGRRILAGSGAGVASAAAAGSRAGTAGRPQSDGITKPQQPQFESSQASPTAAPRSRPDDLNAPEAGSTIQPAIPTGKEGGHFDPKAAQNFNQPGVNRLRNPAGIQTGRSGTQPLSGVEHPEQIRSSMGNQAPGGSPASERDLLKRKLEQAKYNLEHMRDQARDKIDNRIDEGEKRKLEREKAFADEAERPAKMKAALDKAKADRRNLYRGGANPADVRNMTQKAAQGDLKGATKEGLNTAASLGGDKAFYWGMGALIPSFGLSLIVLDILLVAAKAFKVKLKIWQQLAIVGLNLVVVVVVGGLGILTVTVSCQAIGAGGEFASYLGSRVVDIATGTTAAGGIRDLCSQVNDLVAGNLGIGFGYSGPSVDGSGGLDLNSVPNLNSSEQSRFDATVNRGGAYLGFIGKYSYAYGIDPCWPFALMVQESGGDANIASVILPGSRAGTPLHLPEDNDQLNFNNLGHAIGLMQITIFGRAHRYFPKQGYENGVPGRYGYEILAPAYRYAVSESSNLETYYTVEKLRNPEINIHAGVAHLYHQLRNSKGDIIAAVGYYNGEGGNAQNINYKAQAPKYYKECKVNNLFAN